MPAKRELTMRQMRQALRLHADKMSEREIGRTIGVARSTVQDALKRAEAAGLVWPLAADVSDEVLERRLFAKAGTKTGHRRRVEPDWSRLVGELKRPGVNLMILWEEYREVHGEGYGYSRFCDLFREFEKRLSPTMRQHHVAGEKVFVDYSGKRVAIADPRTGEIREAEIFVAVLGASNLTFVEATWTQKLPDWFGSHVRMFRSFGGVPKLVVPDNLKSWLTDLLGPSPRSPEPVAIIDLSLVPSDIVHVTVAVIARLVFQALQRLAKHNSQSLPTVLVLEEAHTFVRRDADQGVSEPAADTCRQVFEKIAREGRKFGLGLVLASQRPSELSPTVLAQCNTFLLHRIVNDEDQRLVRRLVPDSLGGLLNELPVLPSQQAILLGWAVPTPVLVKMRHLQHRPRSDDPSFWAGWCDPDIPHPDWGPVAEVWSTGDAGLGLPPVAGEHIPNTD